MLAATQNFYFILVLGPYMHVLRAYSEYRVNSKLTLALSSGITNGGAQETKCGAGD